MEIKAPKTTDDYIKAGCELLDSRDPGWAGRINLDALDMVSCEKCVIGQLFGHYISGLDTLKIFGGFSYGFSAWPFGAENEGWTDLTNRWKAVIRARQQEQAVAEEALKEEALVETH